MSDSSVSSGGSAGYRGYEYQRDVSVWVALSLLLGDGPGAGTEMVVEPASAEDLEVALEASAQGTSPALQVDGPTRLTVQVKYRDTGSWSAADFRKLVEDRPKQGVRGPEPRARAKAQLLRDPDRRYVLVTNATVERELAPLRVTRVDEAPEGSLAPGLAADEKEEASLTGRFAIVPLMVPAWLLSQIEDLLGSSGHVPAGRIDGAVQALRRAVEDRMLGSGASLTRAHVEGIVRGAGGLPHPDAELSEYRPPASVDTARTLLDREHAVLLVGPPGYGKSLTARRLVYDLRLAQPPFEIVDITAGRAGIDRALSEPGRHVFYLDDPWGNAGLTGDTQSWAVELPKLLARATPDKRFIITSRSEIYRLALGARSDDPWNRITCPIDRDSYPPVLRWEILLGKIAGSEGGWREDLVTQHRRHLLRELASPLALDRFAKGLRRCEGPGAVNLETLISDAQIEGIKRVVMQQVNVWPRGSTHACVVWALLRGGRGTVDMNRLRMLQRELERQPGFLDLDLEAFVEHLQPSTLTVGPEGLVSGHSKVTEGLQEVVTLHRSEARRVLDATAAALYGLRTRDEAFAGDLFGLVDAVNALGGTGVELSDEVREPIDQLLLDRFLAAEDYEAAGALRSLISRAGDTLPAARFARYLDRGAGSAMEDETGWPSGWRAPVLEPEEIAAIRADAASARVAETWITYVLADATTDYDAGNLLGWLAPFGFDLDSAFMDACVEMAADARYQRNADTVIEAVLARAEPPYDVVFDLIEGWERLVEEEAAKRQTRPAWQAELDFAEQLHLQERYEEEGAIIKIAVDAYLRARRRREGYGWVAGYRRADLVLPSWAEAMLHADPPVTAEEVEAFFSVAGDDQSLREHGLRLIGPRKLASELGRLSQTLRTGTSRDRRASVYALNWLLEREELIDVVVSAMADVPEGDQVDMLLACSEASFPSTGEESVLQAVAARAPVEIQAAFRFAILLKGKSPAAEDVHAAFLRIPRDQGMRLIERAPLRVAGTLLSVAAHEGFPVADIAGRWLESEDDDAVRAGVDALVRLGTAETRTRAAAMLEHAHYRVRRFAVELLAPAASAAERKLILARADDDSAEVARAVAAVIDENRWEDGLPVLLRLLRHQRNYARHPEYGHEPPYQFHVARRAAEALDRLKRMPQYAVSGIIEFVESGVAVSQDVELHALLVAALARVRQPSIAPLLTRLLRDPRVLAFREENLYPVRYAAAWALAAHVASVPDHGPIDWAEVARCARHPDAQLAGPCLILAGMRLDAAQGPEPEILDALRATETTDERRAVAMLTFDAVARARALALRYGILPPGHPIIADGASDATTESASGGWPLTAAMEAWLRCLEVQRDVEGLVLKLAEQRTGVAFGTGDFDPRALRWSKPDVPLVTFSEMFGME